MSKLINKIKGNKLLVFVLLLYVLLFIFQPDKGILALGNSLYYFKELIQVMPIIFVLTIAIDVWVPKEFITRGMGKGSGIKGSIYAIVLGSVSAGPIYVAFPICKKLLDKGASIRNIVIIISSWAVIKVPMLVNEVKFLGFKFMIIRWILTLLAILLMGEISERILKTKDIPASKQQKGLHIKADYCVGCGLCCKKFPQHCEMVSGKAVLKSEKLSKIKLEEFINICPMHAIERG